LKSLFRALHSSGILGQVHQRLEFKGVHCIASGRISFHHSFPLLIMATLVQITPASRHPPQPYPIVRPSSSSSVPLSQRGQPLYLVSATPQMYMQQQHHQQPPPLMTFDFTRQTHQAQQQAKQAQLPQRRQNSLSPQPNSAPPHPRPQQGMHARSRSDEALRDKSHIQSQIRSSVQVSSTPQAQSAPRPQSAQFRPSTALPSPPPIASGGPRPLSADGFRPPTNADSHRGRYGDRRPRYSPGPSTSGEGGVVYMPSPVARGGYHQPRYSADDILTVKSMGANTHSHQIHPQTTSQHPIHGQYQNTKYQAHPHAYPPSVQSQQYPSSHSKPPPPSSPQPSHSKPQQSPRPQHSQPPSNIKQRQSSLTSRSDAQRVARVMSPPPRQLKRSSSEPELPPPQTIPIHRKSSSSSSNISAASAPSQLETASSHSSIPPPSLEHVPFTPSPLAKEIETPTINVIPAPEAKVKTSLSARLRRALSFSSSSNLSTSASTPDLHSAAQEDEADDTISISSTASSASVMLRKMSQGIKRSRKSIIGIFKGARRRRRDEIGEEEEDKFPFGVPGEETSVGVSYVTVEGEISRESDERRKSMIFSDRETSLKTKVSKQKFENGSIRGILKSNQTCRQKLME
jgi:hypothetical protein